MSLFQSNVVTALQDALNASSLRQQVLANNIANAATPGFKRSDVHFAGLLAQALGSSNRLPMAADNPRDLGGVPSLADLVPRVVTDNSTSAQLDGNNVNMDAEQADMAANAIYYETAAQEIGDRLSLDDYVINTNA
ncbi:MAG: flagellar basal body rod protein FlgB [Peptococcaceae bacterium]|nr:flagellar basal body rod protein FlgB [Peptococcaceae bacterium]